MKKHDIRMIIYCIMIFLFLLLYSSIGKADVWIYNSKNYTVWTNQSGWYDFMGESIIPNLDLNSIVVKKYGTIETPTKCYVKTLSNVTLVSSSFIGLECQLNYSYVKGSKYWIGYGNDGSGTYYRAYSDITVSPLPFNMSSFYVINSVQCHTSSCTNLTTFWLGNYALNVSYYTNISTPNLIINSNLPSFVQNINDNPLIVNFNGTIQNSASTLFNCSFYNFSNFIETKLNLNLTENSNFTLNTTNMSASAFGFVLNCSNHEMQNTTGDYNIIIDTVIPIIYLNYVNETSFNLGDTLNFYSNYSDLQISAYEIILKNAYGVILQNLTAKNLTGIFYINYTSWASDSLGTITLSLTAWDLQNHNVGILGDLNTNIQIYKFYITTSSVSVNLSNLENLTAQQLLELKKSNEGINMLAWILLFIILFIVGIFVNSLFIALSGVPLLIISFTYLNNAISNLDLALFWVFLVLGFMFIILGLTVSIINGMKQAKSNKDGDFEYKDY